MLLQICLFWIFHESEIIQYAALYVWLISLAKCFQVSSILKHKSTHYSILSPNNNYTDIPNFIYHSSREGHLGYFYFYFLFYFFILTQGHFFIAFRERGRERNINVRDKYWLVAACSHLDQVPNWQPRSVPWLGIDLQPFSYETMLQPTVPHQPGLFVLSGSY